MRLRVTSTERNAGDKAIECIRSVEFQTHRDWTHHFFDACSGDETWDNVVEYVRDNDLSRMNQICVTEETPTGALDKLLPLWRSFADDDVIVWLDGDDSLATDMALEVVNSYHEQGALCTYGQFIWRDGLVGFAKDISSMWLNHRDRPWAATHLKTFRAGLVKRIKDEHLRDENGEYYSLYLDRCIMYPILEMVPYRCSFIPNILYKYNGSAAPVEGEQRVLDRIINSPRYERIAYP